MLVINLQGTWDLYLDGEKKYSTPPTSNDTICLPDSTAHAGKGTENPEPNTEHMTDRYYFEGYAWYSRNIFVEESWSDKKITLFLERTRISTVYIDGEEIGTENSLCGFHKHDLTGKLSPGEHLLTIRVNNSDYPTRGGHMTSPDTQTNWNGILGRMELQVREKCYPKNLQVTAHTPEKVEIRADICGDKWNETGICEKELNKAENNSGIAQVTIRRKNGEVLQEGNFSFTEGRLLAVMALEGKDLLWDEYYPNLLEAEVMVGKECESSYFGIRKLSHDGRRLLINDREVFWRGKHDGLVFPRTGYAPMTVEEWKQVFETAKSYGINHYRFHTCCPPDAAFAAADEMGIYMEPELPFWGTIAAPGEEGYNEEEQVYLVEEGYRILEYFGNHPSFVMLSMGNELWGSMDRINSFLRDYKLADERHMYTQGSNNFQFSPAILPDEDVFCGVRLAGDRLFRGSYAMCDAPQGHIQTGAPNASHNYDDIIAPVLVKEAEVGEGYIEIQYGTGTKKVKTVSGEQALIPQIPVVSHEIGQYDFFPDFTELNRYEGSQQPLYLELYRERMEKSGIYEQWQDFYKAAGNLTIDCYRREIEAALRSKELSGFQLLDLQDFPGQCVALVGVLNAWMESKGLISAQEWRQFCNDTVILAELDSFVVKEQQTITMPVKLSVCNWDAFGGTQLEYRIVAGSQRAAGDKKQESAQGHVLAEGQLVIEKGTSRLQDVGVVTFHIPALNQPEKVQIELWIADTEYRNQYTLWAYPEVEIEISESSIIYGNKQVRIARTETEVSECQASKQAFIYIPDPAKEDVEGAYCTDFWNYPMFRSISESMNRKVPVGTLGLCIDKGNELLKGFACESYSTPQWYQLVMHSHCTVLDNIENVQVIVQPIDNVERCHKLGMLYYQDDVLVCTSRLWEIGEHPEVRMFAKTLVEQCLCTSIDDPYCIHTVEELMEYIDEIGFLPLFKNDIPGFSVEERTVAGYWWSGNTERDPWEWREIVARSGKIAYGKFFDKKAGFISKKWFPYFANYRRNGYDFDALWDDEQASIRQKKIMDLFETDDTEMYSFEVKKLAGFGKGGEKNFDGTVTNLQMQMYLCMRDFRQKKNKAGENYGWPIAVYSKPEHLWGYDYVTSAYGEEPEESGRRIVQYMMELYPIATEAQIRKVMGVR